MRYFHSDISRGFNLSGEEKIEVLRKELRKADAVVIGAGAGLSTAAGLTYSGERFEKYFSDFEEKYGFRDMYSGGFYPYQSLEQFWGFWCRSIWINRYSPIPSDLYTKLFSLVKDKDYFVLTTNVDHCFQRTEFDKTRLFYTQGDYGLFQSSHPREASLYKTYDNKDLIRKMVESEGYTVLENGELTVKDGVELKTEIPLDLVPICPDDNEPMATNLRIDNFFVEDEGWNLASERYNRFIKEHQKQHVLYLELGVGMNTPVIIKYPFWRYTDEQKKAFYVCINKGEAYCPEEIEKRSLCIDGDISEIVNSLKTI